MTEKLSTDMIEKISIFDENYADITERVEKSAEKSGRKIGDIMLLAATKTVPYEVINHAINSGISFIGENRVQEFLSKNDFISKDVHRHFIGHLQTNKVKDIIDKVEMIESVHSLKLANEIARLAVKNNKVMDILVEVNIGNEESKSGFKPDEVEKAICEISKIDGVRICGLMAIPPICEKISEKNEYFSKMHKLFIDIQGKKLDNVNMVYLSMGMSDDFEQAIENGANIVRIGTALFGKRLYF